MMAGESQKRAQRKWLDANPEYMREYMRAWRERNRSRIQDYAAEWRIRNPGRVASYNAAYESCIDGQTPRWADLDSINRIYVQARELELTVDHIYPLRGAKVCGLHVENNLRLVTHSQNASKGNAMPVCDFEPTHA